jgi:hypothetical protein
VLKEQHARVAQDERRSLDATLGAADMRQVRRRVVLHLFAGREVVASGRCRRFVTDTVAATEGGQ